MQLNLESDLIKSVFGIVGKSWKWIFWYN